LIKQRSAAKLTMDRMFLAVFSERRTTVSKRLMRLMPRSKTSVGFAERRSENFGLSFS
jgi:hypothetical protein